MKWNDVCHLLASGNKNGIAAILESHYGGVHPTEKSKDDPKQGEYSLSKKFKRVEQPYHKVYE